MSKLALLGGTPVLSGPLPRYTTIGKAERDAVARVIDANCLSGFYGSWGDEFFGGGVVRAFEQAWCEKFNVQYAVSVNSATSGLYAAMGAIGISPGDEVIVPPYTMSATAMAPLIYGGIPVFADIEPATFCLSPDAVRAAITPRTKAIIAVNLFGHPACLQELKSIAQNNGLKLIEDNAQGILAKEHEHYAGTIGHIGVFSLNYHKHIQTGEGGMCVTNDPGLALRLQLIRNHAESVVEAARLGDLTNMVGFNYRLTELCAAVGIEQLKRVEEHVNARVRIAQALSKGISGLPGLTVPVVRDGCNHVYYVWALRFDEKIVGISRTQFSRALAAEGFPHGTGYVRPLYHLPLFQKKRAFGGQGYPFNLSAVQYVQGMCPVAERMYAQELITFEPCIYDISDTKLTLLVEALHKVYTQRYELTTAHALCA